MVSSFLQRVHTLCFPTLTTLLALAVSVEVSQASNPISASKRPDRPPTGALLNVDFGTATATTGVAATGDGPTDYWNPYWAPYQTHGELPDLWWSNGQLSGVSLSVDNAPGAWSNGHPNPMMDTFVHSFGGQTILLTFQNLPNGTYDVYVYGHGDYPDNQNSTISAQASGVTYGPETTAADSQWSSATWVEGKQYVLLTSVSVVAGAPLVVSVAPDQIPQASLNGIQLRQTSEHAKHVKPPKVERPPKDPLLNIDLGSAVPWYGVAATGNAPTDYWNYLYAPYQYFAELFDLKWSNQELSAVNATIENAPGLWYNNHPNPMMNSFIHSFGNQPVVITLSDLPNGTYDVYVYAHGDYPDNQNAVITAEADGVVYGPEATAVDNRWMSTTWIEGAQYVLLEKVSVTAGSPLVIRANPDAIPQASVNGIQLRQTSQHAKKVKPAKLDKPPKDALLNMDLGASTHWTGMAATGNLSTDYWNTSYAPYQYFAEVFDLKWSDGTSSGASVTIENAPGLWNNGHPNPMMDTFIHSFGGQAVLITLTDLPAGTYQVYAYAHGGYPDTQNSVVSAQSGAINYGPEVTTTTSSWLSPTWLEGAQYVRFEDVTVEDGVPLVIRVAPGTAEYFEYAFANGFQLRRTSKH